MRPRARSESLTRQWPKFGRETMARSAMRSSSHEHRPRLAHLLQGLGEDGVVEGVGREVVEVAVGVALHHRQPARQAGLRRPRGLISSPRPSTPFSLARSSSRAPSPQPTSSTRAPGRTSRTISRKFSEGSPKLTGPAPAPPASRNPSSARVQHRLVEQEGVVALVGLDLDEAGARAGGVQRPHDRAALGGRIEPVGGEGEHAEAHVARGRERLGEDAAVAGREVEIVDRAGDVEVGVGVEAVDEARPLVAQIALDLEVGVEAPRQAVALQLAAELALQGGLGEVGDVRGHARDRPAPFRGARRPERSRRRASPDRP